MADNNGNFSNDNNGLLMIEELDNKATKVPKKLIHDIKNIFTRNSQIIQNLDNIIEKYEGSNSSIDTLEKTLMKFKKQEEMAKNMQTAIFPSILPDNKIISITAKLLSMDETSGDFYDVIEVISNSVYGVLLADISGHGVSAALITNLAKMLFIKASEKYSSPKDVLSYVNDEICIILHQRSYFTAVYILVDFPNKQIVHSSAGHPYTMRYNAKSKSIEKLETNNMVIGVSKGREFEEKALDFNVGDKVILYTDGISEARNENKEMFSDERLKKLLLDNIEAPSKEILDLVEYEVKRFTGREKFDDDVTMIIIDVKSDEDKAEDAVRSKAYHTKDETTRLIEYYKRSIKLKEKHKDREGVVKDMRKLAVNMMEKKQLEESYQYLEKAKDIALDIDNERILGEVYFGYGLYYDNSGDYYKALNFLDKSLECYKNVDYKEGLSAVYNNMSIMYSRTNDLEKAKKYIYNAIEALETMEKNPKHMTSMALYYNNLGVNFMRENDTDESLKYFIKSSELAEEYDFLKLLATTFNNIGLVYVKRYEFENALKYFYKGLNILEDIDHKALLSTICTNIAIIYFYSNECELCLYYLRKGVKIAVKYHMPYSEIINRTQRAYFLNKQNKIYESLLDIIEINKIKEKIKVNPSEPTLHITIGELVNKYYNNKITDIENKQEIESLFDIILSEFDNIKDAEWYFKKALDISQNPMEVDDYITSNYEYATFLHNRGNNDDKERAVSLLKEAYLTAKKYNEILSVNTIKNLLRKLNIEENQVIE